MVRPQSIVNFERCYLGSVAIGIVNNVLNWRTTEDAINVAGATGLPDWFVPVTVIVGIGINLLLWYFIARRGSNVAKWILTVFFIFGVFALLFSLVRGSFPEGLVGVLGIVGFVLQAIAIWMMLRPDAKRWFARDADLGQTFS